MSLDLHLFSTHPVSRSDSTPPKAMEGVEGGVHVHLMEHDTEFLRQHFDSDSNCAWAGKIRSEEKTTAPKSCCDLHLKMWVKGSDLSLGSHGLSPLAK